MKVVVIGASSAIAHETAKLFARDGAELLLVGRSETKLTSVAGDLRVRGAGRVETYLLDLSDPERHQELFERTALFIPDIPPAPFIE